MAENQEEAFTFRLFARKLGAPTLSSNECSDPPKVVLRSPAPENRSPQFLVSRKSDSHYFTGRFDTAKAEQYREAVVTGEDIIERSRQRWVCQRGRISFLHAIGLHFLAWLGNAVESNGDHVCRINSIF